MFWGRRDWIEPLHIQIEKKRTEMIETGMDYGFTHKRTVEISQELDQLLNQYDRVLLYKNQVRILIRKIQTSMFKTSITEKYRPLHHLATAMTSLGYIQIL